MVNGLVDEERILRQTCGKAFAGEGVSGAATGSHLKMLRLNMVFYTSRWNQPSDFSNQRNVPNYDVSPSLPNGYTWVYRMDQ